VPQPGQYQEEELLLDIVRGAAKEGCEDLPGAVFLHVYDLSEDFQKANELLTFSWRSVALGGAFHVGVEVFGSEWSFGYKGVRSLVPRTNAGHVYNSSLCLGITSLTKHQVGTLLYQMCTQWRGAQYHLIRRYCCTFAAELCRRLGTAPIPAWVTRFPHILDAGLDAGRQALQEVEKWQEAVRSIVGVGDAKKRMSNSEIAEWCRDVNLSNEEVPNVPRSRIPDLAYRVKSRPRSVSCSHSDHITDKENLIPHANHPQEPRRCLHQPNTISNRSNERLPMKYASPQCILDPNSPHSVAYYGFDREMRRRTFSAAGFAYQPAAAQNQHAIIHGFDAASPHNSSVTISCTPLSVARYAGGVAMRIA